MSLLAGCKKEVLPEAIITATTLSGGKTDACSVTVNKKDNPGPKPGDTHLGFPIRPVH